MKTFRYLVISDLHISIKTRKTGLADVFSAISKGLLHLSFTSSHDPDLLDALAEFAERVCDGIDAILIPGDLATTGNRQDLVKAHEFVAGLSNPGLPKCYKWLLPGNHDRFKGSLCLPGGNEFDSVFSNFWTVGQSAQILGVSKGGQERLVVLGADFTLQDKKDAKSISGEWGQGKVYDPVFRELERLTNSIRATNPDAGVIWLTHFPPGFPEGEQALEIIDGDNLIDFALDNNILIISGHTHNPKEYASSIPSRYPDTIQIFCAGTATQLISSVGHVIHILNVQVHKDGVLSVERQDFWWNDDFNRFM